MLDRAIIDHASPTLARLKLGNLFNYPMSAGFDAEFADLQALLEGKGVSLSVLRETRDKALVYIYRTDELEKALRDDRIRPLLRPCGYARFDVSGALETLKSRLNDAETFPHEIGVFLGYPLEDVQGLIENGSKNCLACGCWKVYANECAALAASRRYEKCKSVYLNGCKMGRVCPLGESVYSEWSDSRCRTARQILGDSGGCRETDKTEVWSQAPKVIKRGPIGGFLFCLQVSIF